MGYFWVNKDVKSKINTYEELLDFLQNDTKIILNYKGKDVSFLYANLIKALLYGYDYNLLDSDFSDEEIQKLTGSKYKENWVTINANKFIDWMDVLVSIEKSHSSVILYTSGTTGLPKKVIQPLSNLIREVRINKFHTESIWGFAYNPTHMAGIQVLFQAIFNQNPLVNLFNKNKDEIYDLIDIENITSISATPTFYRLLLPFRNTCFSVKRITFGGEKSNAKLYKQVREIFPNAKFSNIYASTEAGSLLSSNEEGFFIPEAKKKLIKINNFELLIHISLLGNVTNIPVIDDNWYATGDLIQWIDDKKEFFVFSSRKNEMINIGGYKVNPYEVEEMLNSIEYIHSSRVYGRENSILGNILMAEVVIIDKSSIGENEIKTFLGNHLQNFKIPRKIIFVDDLSYSRTGKLIRK